VYAHGQERWKLIWPAFFWLFVVFALTTPFDFSWPDLVLNGMPAASIHDAIVNIHRGNMARRLGMVMLAGFAVFLLSRTRNRFRLNFPVGWFLVLYLAWSLLSLTWSIDTLFTLRRVVTAFILWLAAYAVAIRYSLREQAWLTVLVAGATLVLGVGNELRLHTLEPVNELWRFSGLFHAVAMGWNCSVLVLAAGFLATDEKHGIRRTFLWFVILFAFVFLILTKTRLAVASTIVCMALYGFLTFSGIKKTLLILVPIIVLCLAYLSLGNRLLYYTGQAGTLGRGEAARESVSTLTGRTLLWEECFRWALKRPLIGYGFNTFISPKHMETVYRNVGWMPNSVHSGYLDALMGLGVVGATVLIFFLLAALARAYLLSLWYGEYIFIMVSLLWLYCNLALAVAPITRPFFTTFFFLMLLARLAFLPGPEWNRRNI